MQINAFDICNIVNFFLLIFFKYSSFLLIKILGESVYAKYPQVTDSFSTERDSIGSVMKALSGEIASHVHIGLASSAVSSPNTTNSESVTKRLLIESLNNLPLRRRSNEDHFLIIATHDIVPAIIEAVRQSLNSFS